MQNKEISDLKSHNENLKDTVEHLEKYMKNYFELSLNSNIILKEYEKENIIKLLRKGIKLKNNFNIIKLNLLFRASIDGDNNKAIHKCCDNISPTLSIIQTKNNYIFGGYTDHIWDNYSGCVKTNNSFMFSLNKNKIYNGKKEHAHIHCGITEGPWFCNGSGVQGDNYLKTEKSFQWGLKTNQETWENFNEAEEFELVGGTSNFMVKEVEVFKVEFI